jgi:hypothetical protein
MKKQIITSAAILATLFIGACEFSASDKKAEVTAAVSSIANASSSGANTSSDMKMSSGMQMSSGMYMSSGMQSDPFMVNVFPKLDKTCQDLYLSANSTPNMQDDAKMQMFIKTCADQVSVIQMPKTLDANCQALYKDAFSKMKASETMNCDPAMPSQECKDAFMAMQTSTTTFHDKCESQAPGLKFPWEGNNQGQVPKECVDVQNMMFKTVELLDQCELVVNKDCSVITKELEMTVVKEQSVCGNYSITKDMPK